MRIKVTVSRNRIVTETAEIEVDIPEYLETKVLEDEKGSFEMQASRQKPIARIMAEEVAKNNKSELTWMRIDGEEISKTLLREYHVS